VVVIVLSPSNEMGAGRPFRETGEMW